MKDLKISSKYDNHICTLENGEKLYSAKVTLHSSDREYLKKLHEEYWNKMDSFEGIGSVDGSTCIVNILGFIYNISPDVIDSDFFETEFPDCKYHFTFTIIYVKEPSNYNIKGVRHMYYGYLFNNLVHHQIPLDERLFKDEEKNK